MSKKDQDLEKFTDAEIKELIKEGDNLIKKIVESGHSFLSIEDRKDLLAEFQKSDILVESLIKDVDNYGKEFSDELLELEVSPLETNITEEKVIEPLAESKTVFNFKKDLFILDNVNQLQRTIDYSGCRPVFENPINVVNSSEQTIGFVNLSQEGNVLVGDFYIDFQTPERLDLENKTMPLYGHIVHYCSLDEFSNSIRASRMHIQGVMVSLQNPLDERVGLLNG